MTSIRRRTLKISAASCSLLCGMCGSAMSQDAAQSTQLPGITVTADQDPINNKIMTTQVTASVQTYFARLFGVNSITASRRARAEFILPVPMGSPQDYYGIYQLCQSGGGCVGAALDVGAHDYDGDGMPAHDLLDRAQPPHPGHLEIHRDEIGCE